MSKSFIVAQINARVMPMDRGELFEDPLGEALEEAGLGELSGGGSMLDANGEIAHVDIEIEVDEATPEVERFIVAKLEERGAPKGSKLEIGEERRELFFGANEGLALYLNGIDLPDEVYERNDVNDLIGNLMEALQEFRFLFSYWQGPTETALYFYAPSFDAMKAAIAPVASSHPLCQKSRVERIA